MSEYTPSIATELLKGVPGGCEMLAWFEGKLPSFHDAEIVETVLDRNHSSCRIKLHGFRITPDLDEKGYFKSVKHVIITFQFTEVTELELTDFNYQNVIDGLTLTRLPNGNLLLEMAPCYGLWGKVEAKSLEISIVPGAPTGSVYAQHASAS